MRKRKWTPNITRVVLCSRSGKSLEDESKTKLYLNEIIRIVLRNADYLTDLAYIIYIPKYS